MTRTYWAFDVPSRLSADFLLALRRWYEFSEDQGSHVESVSVRLNDALSTIFVCKSAMAMATRKQMGAVLTQWRKYDFVGQAVQLRGPLKMGEWIRETKNSSSIRDLAPMPQRGGRKTGGP
jgi:hypothetical protein